MITVRTEILLDVEADVELDYGEICGEPQVLMVEGVPFPRGSKFYGLIMNKARTDLEKEIEEQIEEGRNRESKKHILTQCRQWGGSV